MLHLLLGIFRCQLEIVFAILYFYFDSMIDEVFWMPTSLTSRDIIFRTFCSFYKFRAYTAIYLICQTNSLFFFVFLILHVYEESRCRHLSTSCQFWREILVYRGWLRHSIGDGVLYARIFLLTFFFTKLMYTNSHKHLKEGKLVFVSNTDHSGDQL